MQMIFLRMDSYWEPCVVSPTASKARRERTYVLLQFSQGQFLVTVIRYIIKIRGFIDFWVVHKKNQDKSTIKNHNRVLKS